MPTTEAIQHINRARQVLVGVVPNPTSQIDQITNALIYKFMDDMDQSAIKAGGNPSFFIGDLEKYAWSRLMDPRLGNQGRMNLYAEALTKFSEAKQLPELFRNIFRSAFLPYRTPETLGLFLKEINYFDYSHPEELGNAYEYLLSIMSSQGDAGQFRTPRHIIDFIVKVVNPSKDDKILDPACGTGGFLVSSYKHILEQHDGVDEKGKPNNEKPLTPDDKKKIMKNFEGYDIDPGMVRIAQVNMYLHQFKNPKIFQYDSLSSEERWADKFDVVLANPPFMSPQGGIRPHNKFSIQSTRSEVLFVDYIMHHLRPKGRAGIIVPEGVIFQSGTAYKQLRKNLVEDGLYAVVSLPSGVFNPYAGVKTSILLFDNEIAKKTDEILFIRILNDGFDLGAQRRPRPDLPNDLFDKGGAVDLLNAQKTAVLSGNTNPLIQENSTFAWLVKKEKIAENGDYNLSGDRYRMTTDYTNTKWTSLKLKELEESGDITLGRGQVISKNDLAANPGIYPVYSSSAQGIGEFGQYGDFMFDEELITWSVDGGGRFFYRPKHKFSVTNVSGWLRVNNPQKINAKYLFRVLDTEWKGKTFDYVAKAHPSVIREMYQIPLPPLEIQKQIVAELDGYQKIIDGAKQIVANWKPKIDIDPEWERVKLEKICDMIQRGRSPVYGKSKVQVIKSGQAKGYYDFDFTNRYFVDPTFPLDHRKLQKGDLLLNSTGVGTAGRITLFNLEGSFLVDGHITIIRLNENTADSKFVLYALDSFYGFKKLESMAQGNGGQIELGLSIIKNLELPLPSVEIQKLFVEKIEAERVFVASAKNLIGIYEGKVKEVVGKLWEG